MQKSLHCRNLAGLSKSQMLLRVAGIFFVFWFAGCQNVPSKTEFSDVDALSMKENDKVDKVKCVLPGRIKKLGSSMTYIAPRQVLQSSPVDCKIRGGEIVEQI